MELAYRDAAAEAFDTASFGTSPRDGRFRRSLSWIIDIGVEVGERRV